MSTMLLCKQKSTGFTLIELLIVIGIIGILAAIVILAINPAAQLRKALGIERTHNASQLQKAIAQFAIDYQELPGDKTISNNINSPTQICALGQLAPTCVNIDEIIPTYVGCLPHDELETTIEHSGYYTYTLNGFIRVKSTYENTTESGGSDCIEPPIPIAYWKLDETDDGDLLDDSSGNFSATPININSPEGPSINVASLQFKNNHSWLFNGTDDYASIPNNTAFNLSSSLTISAWILANSFTTADTVNAIVRKGDANPNKWQLAIEDSHVTLILEGGDGVNGRAQSAMTLNTGQWYHVAGTWDGTTAKVYINGTIDGSGVYTGSNGGLLTTDNRPIYIGGRPSTDYFNGYLDDVRVYDTALTAIQISKLAAGWQ